MPTLYQLIPDVQVLLALSPADLAPSLLKLARGSLQPAGFRPEDVTSAERLYSGVRRSVEGYSLHKRPEIELAIGEAWHWLEINALILPAPGLNGRNGWKILSRQGASLATDEDFTRFKQAAAFPKSPLHPAIADKVWLALARGDLDDAVFIAFKAVEVAVRDAGGFGPTDVGVPLMRKAFDKASGRLSKTTDPDAERDALAHLFAGAIGSYKNPHSHRTVTITDPREAQEMLVLASHLLRIVEARQLWRLSRNVDELQLSVRTADCFSRNNIVRIGDLVQMSEAELLRTPNLGRNGLNEIKDVLATMGLRIGMKIPNWLRAIHLIFHLVDRPFGLTLVRLASIFVVLALAGLWENWRSPAGERIRSFAIITTRPNELCAELHNRMPVVLKPAAWPAWIGEEPADAPPPKALLAPYPSEEMVAWPVSQRVGNVKNNDLSLTEPIAGAG